MPARHGSPRPALLTAATLALALLAAPAAQADPVASAGAGTGTILDGSGSTDALSVTLNRNDAPGLDPVGWNLAAFQLAPAVASGAGCQAGLVGVLCPFGGAAPGAITVDLGAGNDELRYEATETAATAAPTLTLRGGPGNDRIAVVRAKATIEGGDGDDLLLPDEIRPLAATPGPVAGSTISGGAGTDTVSYESTPGAVNVSLDGVADDGRGGKNDNVGGDVENIKGPATGSTLTGSDGANRIEGGAGNDTIDGGAGKDVLIGGAGNDEISAFDGAPGDQVSCGDGDDLAFVDFGDTVESLPACEAVSWAPALTSRSLRYSTKTRKVRIGFKCPSTATGCLGTVILRSTGRKPVTLAKDRYAAKRGKKTTISLTLTKAGRKAMKKKAINATALIDLDGGPAPAGPAIKIRR